MAFFSLYHEIHSQYKRGYDGALLESLGNVSLYKALRSRARTPVTEIFIDNNTLTHEYYAFSNRKDVTIHRFELLFSAHISGLLFVTTDIIDMGVLLHQRGLDFRTYFALTLLMQPSSQAVPNPPLISCSSMAAAIATTQASVEKVCGVFEHHLLFQGPENDHWNVGQVLFRNKVHYYIEQRSKIRFCLPAFPCKSSNPDKVATLWPDGAEYEALTNLFNFCLAVQAVYPPGAVLEIVSDGHVFSDCVGVDDETVSEYTRRLRCLAAHIQNDIAKVKDIRDCDELITFQGLAEILYANPSIRKFMKPEFANLNHMFHPVNTRRTP